MINVLIFLLSSIAMFPGIEPDPATIVQKSYDRLYGQGKTLKATVEMVIMNESGDEKMRTFVMLRSQPTKNVKKEQKYYLYFTEPADVRRMSYLVLTDQSGSIQRWMYFSSIDLVKRISTSDERKNFVASDFYYEDISGRDLAKDNFTLLQAENGEYVIKSEPVDPASVEYDHALLRIRSDNYNFLEVKYFGNNGNLIRALAVTERGTFDGYDIATKIRVDDYERKRHTLLSYSDIEFDQAMDDSVFSERSLRRPPRKYIQ